MESVQLFLCGDVMTGRGIDQVLPHPADPVLYESYVRDARQYVALAEGVSGRIEQPVSFDYPWGDALAELERLEPDYRIINLETAVTTSDDPWPGKAVHYRMHPANAPVIAAAKIDCCVLANNHVLDWGHAGLRETLDVLRPTCSACGAGRNVDEAASPAILVSDAGARVLVFACGSPSSGIPSDWGARRDRAGVNLVSELSPGSATDLATHVLSHRRPGDIVVLSIHWGSNWGWEITPQERAFAHTLIDSGAVDIVHGHSSHHVKGFEVYRGKLVLYGCGDFLDDYEGIGGYEAFRGDLALMYFPRVAFETGQLMGLRLTPMRTRGLQSRRASKADRDSLKSLLDRECARFGIRIEDRSGDFEARWD